MDRCEYMYYKEEEKDFTCPFLYCKINNNRCIYSKRCLKVNKFIPIDDVWKECFIMIDENKKHIPEGSFYLETFRPNKRGKLYLYVVIEDKVERILSDFEKIEQNYVYLEKDGDNYKVSLTPFPEKNNIELSYNLIDDEPIVVEQKPKKKQAKKKVNNE